MGSLADDHRRALLAILGPGPQRVAGRISFTREARPDVHGRISKRICGRTLSEYRGVVLIHVVGTEAEADVDPVLRPHSTVTGRCIPVKDIVTDGTVLPLRLKRADTGDAHYRIGCDRHCQIGAAATGKPFKSRLLIKRKEILVL